MKQSLFEKSWPYGRVGKFSGAHGGPDRFGPTGYLRHGEVTAALEALTEDAGESSDGAVGSMISELRAWLAVCAVKGPGLVIFCY